MTTNVNTLTGLTQAIISFTNRTDTVFINNIPIFISLAEQDYFFNCSTLGNQTYSTGTLIAGNATIPKPALWGQTLDFIFLDTLNTLHIVDRVSYEYLRIYNSNPSGFNPDPSLDGITFPKYYTDEGFPYLLLTPVPLEAYKYQWVYYQKIVPLSPSQQSNWILLNDYSTFFKGCLAYAYKFLQNTVEAAAYKQEFFADMQITKKYNEDRTYDRSSDVNKD